MKTLYIMRHGKAEEGYDKADYKRKLIPKGIKRSHKIAARLVDKKIKPDLILCSYSNRTKETAELMADFLNIPNEQIIESKEFYLAPVGVMMETFYAMDDAVSSILVVGHNPGLSELVTSLTGELIDWMPTSALIAVEIDTEKWKEIRNANSKISFSLFPKQ